MSAPLTVIYRPPSLRGYCNFFYSLRNCKPTLAGIIALSDSMSDPEPLDHLLACRECRAHVMRRDSGLENEEAMDMALQAALKRIAERKIGNAQ